MLKTMCNTAFETAVLQKRPKSHYTHYMLAMTTDATTGGHLLF